ncbi:MAG: ABC transporter permease subunit [Caldilineaceae bacterium]
MSNIMALWSFAKFVDLLQHIWLPAVVVGTAGTAGLIRVMRANLLDELERPYVMVARSKGLSEGKMIIKYPFRIALNPVVSTIG